LHGLEDEKYKIMRIAKQLRVQVNNYAFLSGVGKGLLQQIM